MRFRILQIVFNGLLFFFLTYGAVDVAVETHWRIDGQRLAAVVTLLFSCACLFVLVGSIRFNLQMLGHTGLLRSSVTRSSWSHIYSLAFSIGVFYIAIERPAFAPIWYDSHLSTHYMTIEIPDWSWLRISPLDQSIVIQNYEILNLLVYILGVGLLVVTKGVTVPVYIINFINKNLSSSLFKFQIALGMILLLLSVLYLFAIIERFTGFLAFVEFDPALMNLSNLAGYGFSLVNWVLLIVYGQYVLRDGIRFRKS